MDRAQSWLNAADERGINMTDENGYLAVIRDMMLEVVRLNERIAYLEPIFIAARNLTNNVEEWECDGLGLWAQHGWWEPLHDALDLDSDIRTMLQDYDAWTQEQTSGKGVIGSLPGHTEGQKMPGPPGHQSAAGTNCAAECAVRAPESFARGPAADPIADLCARLRGNAETAENEGWPKRGRIFDEAADALERLARTERLLQACVRHETARAKRAEAERDEAKEELQSVLDDWNTIVRASGSPTNGGAVGYVAALCAERDALRECVRAADGLRAECDQVPPMVQQRNVLHAYDAARAKVNTTEGEK